MKVTKAQLKQIIKEELEQMLNEGPPNEDFVEKLGDLAEKGNTEAQDELWALARTPRAPGSIHGAGLPPWPLDVRPVEPASWWALAQNIKGKL